MTAPTPGETEPAQDAGLLTISRADIMKGLAKRKPEMGEVLQLASELALAPSQVMALMAGQADLRLTQAQYDDLRASIASALAGSEEAETVDAASLCGSSSSPAPTTTTATTVPPVTGTKTTVTETTAGTKVRDNVAVGAGTVTIRTDVQAKVGSRTFQNMFALTYKGADSADAHWLQFIHREVIGIDEHGAATPQTGTVGSSGTKGGRSYDLTPGGTATAYGTPAQGNYNTDTASASDPFYESSGAGNRAADATTIYDNPNASPPFVQRAFSNGAKRVVSRAHFDTFLVQVDKVSYHSSLTMTYDLASAADAAAPTTVLNSGASATALPSTIQARFHAQFPAFNFIK
jgi:hypothetical protein